MEAAALLAASLEIVPAVLLASVEPTVSACWQNRVDAPVMEAAAPRAARLAIVPAGLIASVEPMGSAC